MSDIREKLFAHFSEDFSKVIDCDHGWDNILSDMNDVLEILDPNYIIFQIKMKFGELRVYAMCSADSEIPDRIFLGIVNLFERKSRNTCEQTGLPGVLMKRNQWFKTLNPSNAPEGYSIVEREE